MNKTNISISTISLISLFLLTSLAFCFFGAIYYNHQKESELSELDYSLKSTLNQLSKGLSIAVWNFDENEVIGIMESGLHNPYVNEIILEYKDKNKTTLSIVRDKTQRFKVIKDKIDPVPGAILFENDITYGNEEIGKITVCGTTQLVYEELNKEVTLIACFILFVIIFIMVGVYCIYYFIVIKPLKFLEQYSLAINFENYNPDQIIEKKFFKEPEQLRFSLQKMVASLNGNYKKLEDSERKFKEMTNLLPQAVFEMDLTANFVFINEVGLTKLGLTKSDVERGACFFDFLSKEERERARLNMELIISGVTTTGGNEYEIVRRDGSVFPAMIYSAPIIEDNKPVGFRGVGIDLTEQRKNEAAFNELVQLNFAKEKESEKLRTLALMEGQEKERLRISREIHDGIGQMMTAIKISIESIDTVFADCDTGKFNYTKTLIYEVISELRQVSRDLSPTFLYEYGLYPAVRQLTNNVARMGCINVYLNSNIKKERLSSLVEITIYRIVQEALNNALKYSGAQNIKISLIQDAEFLELIVEDDGVGFDISSKVNSDLNSGNGLRNITSRANLMGAEFRIVSAKGEGVQIILQIPIDNTVAAVDGVV